MLIFVAVSLIRSNASLLIGVAVPERLEEQLRLELTAIPAVDQVTELDTSVIGISEVLVAPGRPSLPVPTFPLPRTRPSDGFRAATP